MSENFISAVTSKSQTVIPKAILLRMGLKSGDHIRYVVKGDKVEIEKLRDKDGFDPFATFTEWALEADEDASAHFRKISTGAELVQLSRQLFAGDKGVDLELPSRQNKRLPPDFDTDGSGW